MKIAKDALDKALVEDEDIEGISTPSQLPIVAEPAMDLNQPLIIKTDQSEEDNHEK